MADGPYLGEYMMARPMAACPPFVLVCAVLKLRHLRKVSCFRAQMPNRISSILTTPGVAYNQHISATRDASLTCRPCIITVLNGDIAGTWKLKLDGIRASFFPNNHQSPNLIRMEPQGLTASWIYLPSFGSTQWYSLGPVSFEYPRN